MKIFKLTLSLTFVLISLLGVSQDNDAKAILDQLSEKTRKYSSITSDFTFTLDDVSADVHHSQEGMVKMKGSSYYIALGDNHIFSDGETRWTFAEEMNEVYIDDSESGDDALNPTEIYTVWEKGFKHYYESEVTVNGRICHMIKLNPTKPDEKTFHTVNLFIDKAKMELVKIEILGKQGDNYTYNMKSFEPDISYTEKDFIFDMGAHPGVEVIDNR